MGEISAESQLAKINNFHKGFTATHLINIGGRRYRTQLYI
jgi:hypothetical protein